MTYIPAQTGTSINQLQDAPGSLQGTDYIVVNRGGVDYRAALTTVNTFIGGTAPVYATAFTMGLSAASGTASTPVVVTYTPTTNAWPVGTVITPTVATLTGTFSPTTISVSGSTPGTTTFTPTSTAGTSGTIGGTTSPSMTNTTGTVAYAISATTATAYTTTLSASSGFTGSAVTVTIAPTAGAWPATTITPSLAGSSTATGTFSPTSVTPTTGSSGSVTVSFTPSTSGSAVIHTAHTGGTLTSDPADKTYTVSAAPATGFTFTQSGTSGNVSAAHTVTVTPTGGVWPTGTSITPSVSGVSGTYGTTPIVPSVGTTTAATSILTPTTAGTATLSVTNNQSWSNPANLTYTVTSISNPSTLLTSPIAWYDVPNSSYSDTAMTAHATNGQSIVRLKNLLGNGSRELIGSASDLTYVSNLQNGLPGVWNSTSFAGCFYSNDGSWQTALGGDLTVFMVLKANTVFNPQAFWASNSGHWSLNLTGNGISWAYSDGTIADNGLGTDTGVMNIVARADNTAKTIKLKINNRTEISGTYTTALTPGAETGIAIINWLGSQSYEFFEFAFSPTFESNTVRDNLITYGINRWGT